MCPRCCAFFCGKCATDAAPGGQISDVNFTPPVAALLRQAIGLPTRADRAELWDPARNEGERRVVAAAQMFLQRPDVASHAFWAQVIDVTPPRVLVKHLARIFRVDLHVSVQLPSTSGDIWRDEVERYTAMFEVTVDVPQTFTWFQSVSAHTRGAVADTAQEVRASSEQPNTPFMTDPLRDHLRKLKGHKFIRGARAWQYAHRMSVLAHVPQASGTTDLDAICYHLEVILGNMQRHIVSPTLGKVLLTVAFLRVFTARRARGKMPQICHNNPLLAVLVSEVHSLLAMRSASTVAFLREWWDSLGVRPPPQHPTVGRKRKHVSADEDHRRQQRCRRRSSARSLRITHCDVGPPSPVGGWERTGDEEPVPRDSAPVDVSQVVMCRCLTTGTVHMVREDGSSYCVWKMKTPMQPCQRVASTVSEHRCPVCFARRERELCGGSCLRLASASPVAAANGCHSQHVCVISLKCRVCSGHAAAPFLMCGGSSFRELGQLPDTQDPMATRIDDFKEAVGTRSDGLLPDWSNFFASDHRKELLVDMESLAHINTPDKLKEDIRQHIGDLVAARGTMDLDACIQRAKDIRASSCFNKLDIEAFTFLAGIYGTDVHVASALDDSNMSFFTSRNVLKVFDGRGLWVKFLIHTHHHHFRSSQKPFVCVLCERRLTAG